MTCRETEKLLDLFLDGELEARAMRTVALHVTRCAACESMLQRHERLQDVMSDVFAEAVAEVDFSSFWPSIAGRLADVRPPWTHRVRDASARLRSLGRSPTLTVATSAAVAVLAALLVWRGIPAAPDRPRRSPNNQVRIDSLEAGTSSVALLSESESNTTVIWIVDEGTVP